MTDNINIVDSVYLQSQVSIGTHFNCCYVPLAPTKIQNLYWTPKNLITAY